MRIHTVKKNIRSNHTIRFGGFGQAGTKRNGIVSGLCGSDKINEIIEIIDDKKIIDGHSILPLHPRIKYNSTVRCCQKCGGTRFAYKAIFCETNQFGKGIYRPGKKYIQNPLNLYDE
jgi:hypothetical protein